MQLHLPESPDDVFGYMVRSGRGFQATSGDMRIGKAGRGRCSCTAQHKRAADSECVGEMRVDSQTPHLPLGRHGILLYGGVSTSRGHSDLIL